MTGSPGCWSTGSRFEKRPATSGAANRWMAVASATPLMLESVHSPGFARVDWSMSDLGDEACLRRTIEMFSGDRGLGTGSCASGHFHRSHPHWEGIPPPLGSGGLTETFSGVHRQWSVQLKWAMARKGVSSGGIYWVWIVRRDRGPGRWGLFLQCSMHRADQTR